MPSCSLLEELRAALIAPFIQALGYDIFNPTEVKPEFSADLPGIKQGERVDYAVLEDGHPKILIAANPYRRADSKSVPVSLTGAVSMG